MANDAVAPRPGPAKARIHKPAYAEQSALEQIRADLEDCRHAIDLQFHRMAQMQAEIDRLKADGQRAADSASGESSNKPSE